MEHALLVFLSRFTYPALLFILAGAGLGLPVSEDLTLLLAGALAARGVTSFWLTLAAGYFGVILGDVLIQHWGRKMGPAAYAHPRVRKALSIERQHKLREHFARHGFLTVVVGRHTPGLRAPIFFLAGASGVPFGLFVLADAFSAAITTPIVVFLGYKFGEHLDDVRRHIHEVQWILLAAVAVGGAIWFAVRRARNKREQPERPSSSIDP